MKVSKIQDHLSIEEIEEKISKIKEFWRVRRWLVIRHALIDPSPAKEIAKHLGLSVHTVHIIIESYNREGPSALETTGKSRRQRAYLSFEEEERFLECFVKQAETGKLVTVHKIHAALNNYLGRKVHLCTIYRLLRRHGWRKLVPRPRHVKAKKEKQAEFKKNSLKK